MSLRRLLYSFLLVPFLTVMAVADPIEGTWATQPDDKNQIGHVVIQPCGAAFCGTLVRAYSPSGERITTPNVGRQLFWDLRAAGGGKYRQGRIYVPVLGADFPVEMTLTGGFLRLRACNSLGICQTRNWQRVR
jgi:uncharacterized protein (DUF2147 family)